MDSNARSMPYIASSSFWHSKQLSLPGVATTTLGTSESLKKTEKFETPLFWIQQQTVYDRHVA